MTLGEPRPTGPVLAGARRVARVVRASRRLFAWGTSPGAFVAPPTGAALPVPIWDAVIPLRRRDPFADPALEDGKRVNVALAAPYFDGVLLTPENGLSFWRTLGRVSASRGFRPGLELRGGCLIPAVGGGLCLLSNALFAMAASLGWTIVERHGHSLEAIPPRPGDLWGLDATARWPDVDLRIAPVSGPARLEVRVEGGALRVRVTSEKPAPPVQLAAIDERLEQEGESTFRYNRIVRTIGDRVDVVALNRKRLVRDLHRTCKTCSETSCWERR